MSRPPEDLWRVATRARAGDLEGLRKLHFPSRECPADFADKAAWLAFVHVAGPLFANLVDAHAPPARRSALPRPGGIDFHRLHCLALDRLPELLAVILPDGHEGGSWGGRWCWIGRHPLRPEPVHVCLMMGCWTEPNTGRAGLDLVSLYSHVFGISAGHGAHLLAQWLGAEMRTYAA